MSVYFASLNSGSNANCYYVSSGTSAVLVDAGLSCRETEKRMDCLGLNIKSVKAIFISHEHIDHINGLEILSKKHRIPVYISKKTWQNTKLLLDLDRLKHFDKDEEVLIEELSVKCFSKSHDAADPFSFMVSNGSISVSVLTDIGYACNEVISYFKQSQVVFLESNYCEKMLANGDYPYQLKKRISANNGHLSNEQALHLFLNYRSANLKYIILCHLSKNNNTPEIVNALFLPHAGATKVIVASRYQQSELFCITEEAASTHPSNIKMKEHHLTQLSLF